MTDEGLVLSRQTGMSGEQRIYRWGNWGLSVVNGSILHYYPFAREAAVIRFIDADPLNFELSYVTKLTQDVEVFSTDADADAFVAAAADYFASLTPTSMAALDKEHADSQVARAESRNRIMEQFLARKE